MRIFDGRQRKGTLVIEATHIYLDTDDEKHLPLKMRSFSDISG